MSIFESFIFLLILTADIEIFAKLLVCLHFAKASTRVEGFALILTEK